jgi:hypothetical protein
MHARLRPALLVICLVSVVSDAYAQSGGSRRPYRGLFGNPAPTRETHSLDLSATLIQAYDDNLLADIGRIRPTPGLSGHYTMLLGDVAYDWQREQFHLGLTASSAARYYSALQEVRSLGHSAGIGVSVGIGDRTTLFLNQSAAYSPSFLYGLFPTLADPAPGMAPPIAPDYEVNDFESFSYSTTARLTRRVGRRGTLSATGDYRGSDFSGQNARPDFSSYSGGAQFSHPMTRNTGLRIGYRYRNGEFGYGRGPATEHGIDAGMTYTRPLSATRRAVFSVGLGSSTTDDPGRVVPADVAGRRYRLLGDASVGYQFSRTWEARVRYRRGVDYVPELAEPVFIAGFSSSVGGFATRRLHVAAAAAYSNGESAAFRRSSAFDTYTGSLRVRWALTRHLAAHAEYLYYYYDFRGNAQLPLGMPSTLDRNGIRLGVTLWVPAVRR